MSDENRAMSTGAEYRPKPRGERENLRIPPAKDTDLGGELNILPNHGAGSAKWQQSLGGIAAGCRPEQSDPSPDEPCRTKNRWPAARYGQSHRYGHTEPAAALPRSAIALNQNELGYRLV